MAQVARTLDKLRVYAVCMINNGDNAANTLELDLAKFTGTGWQPLPVTQSSSLAHCYSATGIRQLMKII